MLKNIKFIASIITLICTLMGVCVNTTAEAAYIEVKMWGGFRDKVIIGGEPVVIARATPGVHVVLPALHILPPPPPHHHMRPPIHHRPPKHRPVLAPPPPKHHDFKKSNRPPAHNRENVGKPLPPKRDALHKPVPRPMPKHRPNVKPAPQPKKRPEVHQSIPQQGPVYSKTTSGMNRSGFGRRPR